jgi:ubiquinone/menaquinone biosynthesis C-methylase UbiE
MLELAKERKNDFKIRGMRIRRGDITTAKFRSKSFDIVLAIYSLPYIINLSPVFGNFYRMLRRGGVLLMASNYYDVKNKNLIGKPISYLLGKIKLKAIIHTKDNYTDAIKNAGFSVRNLRVFKKAYGLRIDPNYKYKRSVRQYTFGAVLMKN